MLERCLRRALKARVEAYGGEVRAVAWLSRPHAPDVLCLLPQQRKSVWVETKGTEAAARPGQLREHKRMREAGCEVLVVRNLTELDAWLPPLS